MRRAAAVGEIARRQLTLDLSGDDDDETGSASTSKPAGRSVVLNLHLSHAAVTGAGGIGHLDNLNLDVLEQQIRSWCGTAAEITVKPVIDLARCAPVDRYDPPAAMVDQVDLRDRHCVFPGAPDPREKCDKDHVVPGSPAT